MLIHHSTCRAALTYSHACMPFCHHSDKYTDNKSNDKLTVNPYWFCSVLNWVNWPSRDSASVLFLTAQSVSTLSNFVEIVFPPCNMWYMFKMFFFSFRWDNVDTNFQCLKATFVGDAPLQMLIRRSQRYTTICKTRCEPSFFQKRKKRRKKKEKLLLIFLR